MSNENKKRVLCVDDDYDTWALVWTILRDYEVVWAANGADALSYASDDDFVLYLVDQTLPDTTGIKVCQKIRAVDKSTPILFITGTSTIFGSDAKSAGAQGLIRKGRLNFVNELSNRVSDLVGA